MAEEVEEPTQETKSIPEAEEDSHLPIELDVNIPDVYSNNSAIVLGGSDVSVVFIHDIDTNAKLQKGLVRVVMTHAVFMNFVAHCNTRAKLLQTVYEGRPPTLGNTKQSEENLEQAIKDMWDRKPADAKFKDVEFEFKGGESNE